MPLQSYLSRLVTLPMAPPRSAFFGIMSRLAEDGGDPAVRASFQKTMSGNFDAAGGAPFTPLELFAMELFRVISPNGGSISVIRDARASAYGALLERIATRKPAWVVLG